MKRLYEISLEVGNGIYSKNYNIIAASDEEAVRKAKRQARLDTSRRGGWRTTSFIERPEKVVA